MTARPGYIPLLWHSYLAMGICGAFGSIWLVPALFCAFLIAFLDRRQWNMPALIVSTLCFISAFIFIGCLIKHNLDTAAQKPAWLAPNMRICGKIKNVQALAGQKLRIILTHAHPENDPAIQALPGDIRWTLRNPPPAFDPLPGQTACVTQTLLESHALANRTDYPDPAIFIHKQYWRIFSQNDEGQPRLSGEPDFLASIRAKLEKKFIDLSSLQDRSNPRSTPDQSQAILLALLFFDRFYLDRATVEDFSAGALAHSLALSGQHLCIAALFALIFVHLAGRAKSGIYLKKPRHIWISLLALPFALAYLWLGNAPPSLLRAFLMLVILSWWIMRARAWHGADLVFTALFLLCCISPLSIFETGLQLSVLCVMIIALIAPIIPNLPKVMQKPYTGWLFSVRLWQIFCISLAIQFFLLPVSLFHFSQTSFWFLLNLFWLPLLGLMVLPSAFSALLLGMFLPQAGSFFLKLAALPCKWQLEIFDFLNTHNALEQTALLLPHWSALCAYGLLLCALLAKFNHKKRKFSKLLVCIALAFLTIGPLLRAANYLIKPVTVSLLDVGQGQAALVSFGGSGRILVDGGGSLSNSFSIGKHVIGPVLSTNEPPMLEAAINSHPDLDHLGGLIDLIPYFNTGAIFHNGHEAAGESALKWHSIKEKYPQETLFAGDVIYLGKKEDNLRLEVLHPPASPFPGSDGKRAIHPLYERNNASLILRLCKGNTGLALLPGDAEKKLLRQLAHSGVELQAQVLISPHHGSDRSLTKDFYRKVNPQMVLASCAYRNRWGFPGKKLQKFLKERKTQLLTTSRLGRIDISFRENEKPAIISVRPSETFEN